MFLLILAILAAVVLGASLAAWIVSLCVRGEERVRSPFRQVKEPASFDGSPSKFKEWLFSLEQAMSVLSLKDAVTFASSYLEGNAKRWYISICENGKKPANWVEFRRLLESNFLPAHEKEQSRVALFRLRQTGSLRDYVSQFSTYSLAAADCDELTKTLLFMEGLSKDLARQVRPKFPQTLQEAVRLAHIAEDCETGTISPTVPEISAVRAVAGESVGSSRQRAWPKKLTPEERQRLQQQSRCFRCRQRGHIAKDCRQYPNAGRQ